MKNKTKMIKLAPAAPSPVERLDEADALKLTNIALRAQLLDKEREALCISFFAKYGKPGETIQLRGDGTFTREVAKK